MSPSDNVDTTSKIMHPLPLRHPLPRETGFDAHPNIFRDRSRPLVVDRPLLQVTAPATPPPGYDGDSLLSRVEVRESKNKVTGLFAKQDIPAGSIILYELPLFVISHTITTAAFHHHGCQLANFKGDDIDPLDAVIEDLSSEKKACFYSLSNHERDSRETENRAIVSSNGFEVLDGVATGIFETACRIKHSCFPNSEFLWCGTKETISTQEIDDCNNGKDLGRLMVFNTLPLTEGKEITIDYEQRGFERGCGCCIDGPESSPSDKGENDSGADNWDGSTTEENTVCNTSEGEDSLPDTEVYQSQREDDGSDRDSTDGSTTEESTLPDTEPCYSEGEDEDGEGDNDDRHESDGYHTDDEPEPNSAKPTSADDTSSESRSAVRDTYFPSGISPCLTPSSPSTSNDSVTCPEAPAPRIPPLPYTQPLGELLEVRTSIHAGKQRGLGVFALDDFLPQTTLIAEKPLLALQYPSNSCRACAHLDPDPIDAIVDNLPVRERMAFQVLHKFSASHSSSENPNREIISTNGFEIGTTNSGPGSATGVFEVICRINHSCRPNSRWSWEQDLQCMMVHTVCEIAKGEEITIDYGWEGEELTANFGFVCECESCSEKEQEDAQAASNLEQVHADFVTLPNPGSENCDQGGEASWDDGSIILGISEDQRHPNLMPASGSTTSADTDDQVISDETSPLHLRGGEAERGSLEGVEYQDEAEDEDYFYSNSENTSDYDSQEMEDSGDEDPELSNRLFELGESCVNSEHPHFGLPRDCSIYFEKSDEEEQDGKPELESEPKGLQAIEDENSTTEALNSTQNEAISDTSSQNSLSRLSIYLHCNTQLHLNSNNSHFKILPSFNPDGTSRGLGIFATTDLPQNTSILTETPLLVLPPRYDENVTHSTVATLPSDCRFAFYSLHAHARRPSYSLEHQICSTNKFQWVNGWVAVFDVISRFNHSCCPNAEVEWFEQIDGGGYGWGEYKMEVVVLKEGGLMAGDEIFIDYGRRGRDLLDYYGFVCQCVGCSAGEVEMAREVGDF